MDLATLIGILVGLLLIIGSISMRGGGTTLFINIPSMMITFGGAFAATLVNYPLKRMIGVFKIASKVVREKEDDPLEIVKTFVEFSKKARTQGLIPLQNDLKNVKNDFLRRGVQLVIDGADQVRIQEELSTEITFLQERHKIGQEVFVTLGTYSPAFGMIGTIMGLIMMLANLQDQSQIAAGMAVALLTTFYGALAAYLFFLPIAGKLKRRSAQEIFLKEVIIQGVLSLQAGEIPSITEAKLKAYLPPSQRTEKPKKVKGAPAAPKKEEPAEPEKGGK